MLHLQQTRKRNAKTDASKPSDSKTEPKHLHGTLPSQESTTLSSILLLCFLICFRMVSALFLKTYDNPDEYWQSLEVAHHMVFGYPYADLYGYLTWEWRSQIRSFAHPLIFAALYKLLATMGLEATFKAPYLLQAIFAGVGDYYTCRFAKRVVGTWISPMILFSTLVSWFNFHNAVRPLSNSLEMVLTVVALYHWPLPGVIAETDARWRRSLLIALAWAALSCVIRPTNGIVWLFLGMHLLWNCPTRRLVILIDTTLVMVLTVTTDLALDTYFYTGFLYTVFTKPIITPLNFLRINVFNSIAIFYGIHSWHWYLTQGLPVLLTTFLPLFISGIRLSRIDPALRLRTIPLSHLLTFVILIYSLLPHKEFRFIYPLLPILLLFTSIGLHNLSQKHKRLAMIALLLTNIPMALYTSVWHQRGVVDVMRWVRERAEPGMDVDFLMPCHSTPWYSEVHDKRIRMRFLGCEPPLDPTDSSYIDEADVFYAGPRRFLLDRFDGPSTKESTQGQPWPTHLVMFEALLEMEDGHGTLRGLLLEKGDSENSKYHECARFFNTHFHGDWRRKGDVIVLCRKDLSNNPVFTT